MVWFAIFYLVMMLAVAQWMIIPLYSNENGLLEALNPELNEDWQEAPTAAKTTVTLLVSFLWPLIVLGTVYMLLVKLFTQ